MDLLVGTVEGTAAAGSGAQQEATQQVPAPEITAGPGRKKRGRSKAGPEKGQVIEAQAGGGHPGAGQEMQQEIAAPLDGKPSKATAAAAVTAARKREAALCALPLPTCLEVLYEAFVVIIRVYRFLLERHVQPTWPLIVVAVRDLQPGAPILQVSSTLPWSIAICFDGW
jgi:hypothetical protein